MSGDYPDTRTLRGTQTKQQKLSRYRGGIRARNFYIYNVTMDKDKGLVEVFGDEPLKLVKE